MAAGAAAGAVAGASVMIWPQTIIAHVARTAGQVSATFHTLPFTVSPLPETVPNDFLFFMLCVV
jgi:hypothetical protein